MDTAIKELINTADDLNVIGVVGLGDIVDDNNATQYATAKRIFYQLPKAGIKTLLQPGNHDNWAPENSYSQTFGAGSEWAEKLTNGYLTTYDWSGCMFVQGGDRVYMIMSIANEGGKTSWNGNNRELNWFKSMLEKYKNIPTIVTTHDVQNCSDTEPSAIKLSKQGQKLRWILDELGINDRLKEFKLNRVNLTRNLYCSSHAEVMTKLNIFKKSRVIPRYKVIKFKDYWSDGNSIHGANHHSWTIASSQNAFSAYDKTYELRKRHGVEIPDEILRLELRLERKRIRQLTKSKTWEEQLVELYEQHDRQFSRFLHRLYQDFNRMLTLPELLEAIEASGFRSKTKKRMARLTKKMGDCESLTAARKKMKLKEKDFIQLLEKFRKLGISPIPMEV